MQQASPSSILRPRISILSRRVSSFQVCGVTGLFLGTAFAMILASASGLSPLIVAALSAAGIFTFLALTMATKIVSGAESLTYYHHEIAILTAAAALLCACGQPPLPYLDLTAMGLGIFLALGRIGCLMAGCCHGRPHRWGVRYGPEHAAEGFPAFYIGARLLPVQAAESLLVMLCVSACSMLIAWGHPAGTALSWYVAAYAAIRFFLEFVRGDPVRLYWEGFSEAQWTSLLLTASIVLAEWRGALPFSWAHMAMCAFLAVMMILLTAHKTAEGELVGTRHATQLAEFLERLDEAASKDRTTQPAVARSSLGVGLSIQKWEANGQTAVLCTFSRENPPLSHSEAAELAALFLNLRPAAFREFSLLRGRHNTFHLVSHGG